VHTLAVHLAPVLAAEKSKTAYYVAGGLLVAWALIVSLLFGLRKPDFPGNLGGQRVVMAISVVLVIAAASTAVITSGGTEKAGAENASATQTATAPQATSPAKEESSTTTTASPSTQGTSTSTPPPATTSKPAKPATKPAKSPKATTGTPAPASSPAAATTLKLAANPAGQLAYDTKQLSAKAGKVTIDMTNASPIEHDVAIAQGSNVVGQTPVFTGGSKSVTLSLKPGTYKFYCTVPGHRQAGMEGTLTVS
jgi:uncharacterized cupredoxin-like copper-binding protein